MEYGSDFSIDLGNLKHTEDNIFNYLAGYHYLNFDSGRSATRYLLRSIRHLHVALPDYLCESIVACFPESTIHYYSIDQKFRIFELESIPWDKIDVFYLLHYFGSVQPKWVLDYVAEKKKQYGFTILEDTTHSIFTRASTIGDYFICSLRKWFPIPDGGVLYSRMTLSLGEYDSLKPIQSNRIDGMVLKKLYLNGAVSDKEAFRRILISAEEQLDIQTDIYRISNISEHILKCQSVTEITKRRKLNHTIVKSTIGDLLPEVLEREESDVPFIYATGTEDRNALRSYLTQRQIYCPVHWPLPEAWESKTAIILSNTLISIPIDQRYSDHEVENAARTVRGFYNE